MGALDPDATYRGVDSGVTYSGRQIGYIGWKGEKEVSVDDGGIYVDGELFRLVEDSDCNQLN